MILGIESSCDETVAAIVKDGRIILSQETASSADIHKLYGGVFPELACRRHIDAILPVIATTLERAGLSKEDLDAIAVTRGPGLVGALLIGLNVAKGLSIAWNKPLIGINHIEAHLYASMMEEMPPLPALGFILSGGHTQMVKIRAIGDYELLGSTVDDAIGEAFDKVATLLGLSYPGGPAIESLAQEGDPSRVRFSPSRVKKNPLAFSFSGLKTAVLYALRDAKKEDHPHIAASFQKTACEDIANKAELAFKQSPYQSLVFGGGVCKNLYLRSLFKKRFPTLPLFWPGPGLSEDNAAMIAGLAYHKTPDPLNLEVMPRFPLNLK